MIEKENVLNILRESVSCLNSGDFVKLKELSNRTVHSSSIDQDSSSILLAVIVYSLSKILERGFYNENSNWNLLYEKILKYLNQSISFLERDDIENFSRSLKLIRVSLNKLDGSLKNNISDVFRKAKINKASKIYEHGISMEKTAKLLGISLWELASYSGQKSVLHSGSELEGVGIKERIGVVEEFFNE